MSNHYKGKEKVEPEYVAHARGVAEQAVYDMAGQMARNEVKKIVDSVVNNLNKFDNDNTVRAGVREILERKGVIRVEKLEMPVARKVEPSESERDKFNKENFEKTIILHTSGYLSNYGVPLSTDGFNALTFYLEGKKPKSYDELNGYLDQAMSAMGYDVGRMAPSSKNMRFTLNPDENPKAKKNEGALFAYLSEEKGGKSAIAMAKAKPEDGFLVLGEVAEETSAAKKKQGREEPAEAKAATMEGALIGRGVDYEANREERARLKDEYEAMGSGKGLEGKGKAAFFDKRVELLEQIAALDKELMDAMRGIKGEFRKDKHFSAEERRLRKEADANKDLLSLERGKERRAEDALGAVEKKAREADKAAQKAAETQAKRLAEREARQAERERRAAEAKKEEPKVAAAGESAKGAADDIMARILGRFKTNIPETTSKPSDREELERQVRGEGVATQEKKSALSATAEAKGRGEAAEIKQIKLKGGDLEVKTEGPGEERQVAAGQKKTKAKEEAGVAEVTPSQEARQRLDKKASDMYGISFGDLVKSQQMEVMDLVSSEIKADIRQSRSMGAREPQNKAAYEKDIERSEKVLDELSRTRIKT